MDERAFTTLVDYVGRLPAVRGRVSTSADAISTTGWWVSFRLDVDDPLAWRSIQEVGHALNGVVGDGVDVWFGPTSTGPWQGGPRDFLDWVICSPDGATRPGTVAKRLADAIPEPFDFWSRDLD
ncbi:MAG: hypothetical protein AAGE98_07665 [Actinomycetota bacterium]